MNPGQVKLPITLNQPEKLTYFGTELSLVMTIPSNANQPIPIIVTNALKYLTQNGMNYPNPNPTALT